MGRGSTGVERAHATSIVENGGERDCRVQIVQRNAPEESNSKKGQGEGKPGSYGEARAESGCLRGDPIGTSGRSPGLSISLMRLGHRSGFQGIFGPHIFTI
jgi:hypothetical protein